MNMNINDYVFTYVCMYNISSIFSRNFEQDASKFLENLEEILLQLHVHKWFAYGDHDKTHHIKQI